MAVSEVFRPSGGPLIVRDNLAAGLGVSADVFRKDRPETRGGYRFGQLSYNSFFARHNPHPSRVRHMKGLLDVPICSVNDDGVVSNPRYSHPQFPPSNHDDVKLNHYSKYAQYYNVPVNAINVNSQRHPINTITGLQYFQGKPLNMRVFREKAVPRMGMVPVTEGWRDELRYLTEALGVAPPQANQPQPQQVGGRPGGTGGSGTGRPRTSQYSAETGRLIPPPSRAMSRGGPSRAGAASRGSTSRQEQYRNKLEHITEDPDMEGQILQMLCQILQTDDIGAVQAWLVNGSDREKEQVLNMIRSALESNDQYYNHRGNPGHTPGDRTPALGDPARGGIDYRAAEEVGRTLGDGDIDRLTLDGDEGRPRTVGGVIERSPWAPGAGAAGGQTHRPATAPGNVPSPRNDNQDDTRPPVLPDIFKAPGTAGGCGRVARAGGGVGGGSRPGSRAAPPRTPALRYTRVETPTGRRGETSSGEDKQLQSILEDKHKVWDPQASVAVHE